MLNRKKAAALFAAFSIFLALILPVFAAGTVDYTPAREIEIRAGGQHPLDLFGNYTKALMPGETVTFRVLVRNTSRMPVNMYLKAADPDDATYAANGADKALSQALLKEMPMHIDLIEGNGATSLFNGLADGSSQTGGGMREFVYLGAAAAGSERFLGSGNNLFPICQPFLVHFIRPTRQSMKLPWSDKQNRMFSSCDGILIVIGSPQRS